MGVPHMRSPAEYMKNLKKQVKLEIQFNIYLALAVYQSLCWMMVCKDE